MDPVDQQIQELLDKYRRRDRKKREPNSREVKEDRRWQAIWNARGYATMVREYMKRPPGPVEPRSAPQSSHLLDAYAKYGRIQSPMRLKKGSRHAHAA